MKYFPLPFIYSVQFGAGCKFRLGQVIFLTCQQIIFRFFSFAAFRYTMCLPNFNQFIKIVIILIIFLYKWMDVCLLHDKLCFRTEVLSVKRPDGSPTIDDIFASVQHFSVFGVPRFSMVKRMS